MSQEESPQPTLTDGPVKRFAKNGTWVLVSQIGAWILGLIVTFLLPPPVGPTQQPQAIENLAQYFTSVLVGIVIVLAILKAKRKHLRFWLIPVPFALLLALGGYFVYSHYLEKWANCLYVHENPPRRIVVGVTETPEAHLARQKDARCNNNSDCNNILYCFAGNEYAVWSKGEIDQRRLILTLLYFSILPFVIVSVLFIIQAIYCANQKDEPGPEDGEPMPAPQGSLG
jgi:energy-coupling factor transporter transmembrane protein EcfT